MNTLFISSVMAMLLSACTPNANTSNTSSIQTPDTDIHTAVLQGNLDVVKQHIEAGTDLNAKEPMGGSTPLISAITFNKPEIAQALIDAKADLSIKNNDGSTALHVAAFFCRVEIVQSLLNAKADKTVKNNYGATPLETVNIPFTDMKPVYEMLQQQLGPLGLKLDLKEIEKTRPVIAMMLQ